MIQVKSMKQIRAAMRLAAHRTLEKNLSNNDRLLIWKYLEAGLSPIEIASLFPTNHNGERMDILLHCEYLLEHYFNRNEK